MPDREDLQSLLEELCDNVYFQPPESFKLSYPCIIYKRDSTNIKFADDGKYLNKKGYLTTVIDYDPDSVITDLVAALQFSNYQRYFVVDNMHHDVFILYY